MGKKAPRLHRLGDKPFDEGVEVPAKISEMLNDQPESVVPVAPLGLHC